MQSCWSPSIFVLSACAVLSISAQCQLSRDGSDPEGPLAPVSSVAAESREPLHSVLDPATKAAASTSEIKAVGGSSSPASLFDIVGEPSTPVVSTVEVHDVPRLPTAESFHVGGAEIVTAAGSFGDVSKFLQSLPGVAASNDSTDVLLVRGGDPMENLFLIDGIQVPNINSLATLGTTGGFGSMIDSAAMQSVNLYTGAYDARFPERLSSVIDIHTLEPTNLTSHSEADFGIEGIGGLVEMPLHGSDLLVSAHHGLLNMLGNFGIDGLPSYTSEFARLRRSNGRGSRLTLLHLGGWDSIKMAPCPGDTSESSTIDSQYSGWRETTGLEWQQVYSRDSFGVVNISDSEQADHIHQQEQLLNPAQVPPSTGTCAESPSAPPPQPVYLEDTNAAFTTAGYRFEWSRSRFTLAAGSAFWLQRPHYQVDQPLGAISPYSVIPQRTDSASFSSDFSSGESGTYAEITARPSRGLDVTAGGRLQSFAFGNHQTLTPRLSLRYGIGEHFSFHVALASYAQMPPYVYLLAYPQNRSLSPMRSTHEVAGIDIGPVLSSEFHIEVYYKRYRDVPASTEYPAVNLHDLQEGLGQQFVWLPMNGAGRGRASGIEFSGTTHLGSRFLARGSLAYARAMFSGPDRVMRPGNVDLPWIVNFAAQQDFGRGYQLATRFAYTSGRPYAPFDLSASLAQNRAVYDTARMNALRAPYYARLDAQLNKSLLLHGVHMQLYLGVNNILNRSNLLGYVWLPRAQAYSKGRVNPVSTIEQMPIFPNFGLRYIFR